MKKSHIIHQNQKKLSTNSSKFEKIMNFIKIRKVLAVIKIRKNLDFH